MSVQEIAVAKAKALQADPSTRELSRLERMFLCAYIDVGCNGKRAAESIKRGGKKPDHWAHQVLSRPWVKLELERRLQAREKATEASIEALREEYRKLAFQPHEGPWLASHRLQAMDRLGNHLGMFRPETAVNVPVTFTFIGAPDDTSPKTVVELIAKPDPKGV